LLIEPSSVRPPKYSPVVDGFSIRDSSVRYSQLTPADNLSNVIHCFWELRTFANLPEDFHLHALPDACVNLLFNLVDTEVAGVTALRTVATTLNLGTSFHYVGVQFYPGAWRGDPNEILDQYVGTPYRGDLPLTQTNQRLVGREFEEMVPVLSELVQWCMVHGYARSSGVTARILSSLDAIRSVADMAALVGLSTRQLQRTIKEQTGLTPHDLLKVLRFQQSFRTHYLDLYADQAHYTHAFRRATGYTPTRYRNRFDV
jgi:AraC-like DNA-binding protein